MLSAAPLTDVNSYVQTNLVSNVVGMALKTDPNLVNPWGENNPQDTGDVLPVVVADQGAGVATSYQISPHGVTVNVLKPSPTVTIPTVGSSGPSGPTGVANNTNLSEFLIPGPAGNNVPATYIFDTLQGTIEGYYADGTTTTTSAVVMVNNSPTSNSSSAGAVYTGLAAGSTGGQDYIYAANEGTCPGIQVFDSCFNPVPLFAQPQTGQFGNFCDPDLPAGFIPYGVRDLSPGTPQTDLFVTYRGPNFQGGAVAVFHNDGTFISQIACDKTSKGPLQSPWGLAFVQGGFGMFSGDLMVGNFSSGQIDAYIIPSPQSSWKSAGNWQLAGTVDNTNGNGTPLTIPGLRSIHFGPGLGDSGMTHVALLFTAETDTSSGNLSLYGMIAPAAASLTWNVRHDTLYAYGNQTTINDTISVDDNGNDGPALVTMNGESASFPKGEISAIDIYPETGANTVSVLNTNVPVTIYDTSFDSVQIGNGDDGLQGINADVDVANSHSLVSLTIRDAHDSIGHSGVILKSDGLIGMSQNPILLGYDSINTLSINGGSGGNTYSIINTPNDANVVLNTGRGDDVVNIGNSSHSASDITGAFQVNGQGGTDTLNVDDHTNKTPQDYVLTDDSISNGILDIVYSGMGFVALKGSSAASSYGIVSTAGNVSYSIQGGGGADAFNVSNLYESLSTIKGDLTINGAGGGDSLTVDSSQDGTSTYGVQTGEISGRDASIYYSSMASVVLNGSSFRGSSYFIYSTTAGTSYTINAGIGADAFDVIPPIQVVGANLDAIAGPLAINGGGGANSLSVNDQNNTAIDTYSISIGAIKRTRAAKITYAGVTTVTLDGGSGNDKFKIKSFDPTVQFAITGGAGVNTLDYSAFSGDVTVDLRLGLATGLTGGISNIQNVTGSKGNDILVGDADQNNLIGGTGRNLIIGGRGANTLIGGPNGDILIGGYTDYDTNIAALNAILAEWDSGDSYAMRYYFITHGRGLNGLYVLNTATVHKDRANDTMTGGAGLDWFFASMGDTITDAVTSEYITMI